MTHGTIFFVTATVMSVLALSKTVFAQVVVSATVDKIQVATDASIRPFHVDISDEALADLHRRIAETRWPEKETVAGDTQGVQLATMQKLAQYWENSYDWRKCEARLNALPQFMTQIDGLDIHFIHVRSKQPKALPIIITHGWPGSIIEQLKIIGPLTDPTSYGGKPEDAFDVVIPSMPGYGFSGKPTATDWDPQHIAQGDANGAPHPEPPAYAKEFSARYTHRTINGWHRPQLAAGSASSFC